MRMKGRARLAAAILIMCMAFSRPGRCQVPTKAHSHRPPDLALKLTPAKNTIALHEGVSISCELTNLTDQTLCFPPPDNGCYFSVTGSRSNSTGIGEGFGFGVGCGCSHCRPSADDLLMDVEQRWVKLPPNQAYAVQCVSSVGLPSRGNWTVNVTYRPDKLDRAQTSLLQSIGCRLPEGEVTSRIGIAAVDGGQNQDTR